MSPQAMALFANILAEHARVQGMVALNMQRQVCGHSMAYDDGSFFESANRIDTLAMELRNMGS